MLRGGGFPQALSPGSSPTFAGLTLTGALTYGGVTLTAAVTGTGSMVLAISPTLTGTLTAAAVTLTGALTSSGATAGIGYATGAGGVVTQLTNKATGVTLSRVTGEITTAADALLASTAVSFVLTNTAIAAGDHVLVNHVSGGTAGGYASTALAAAGSATITIRNISLSSLSEAIVLKFSLLKSVTA